MSDPTWLGSFWASPSNARVTGLGWKADNRTSRVVAVVIVLKVLGVL
jgi:hypothetical protein